MKMNENAHKYCVYEAEALWGIIRTHLRKMYKFPPTPDDLDNEQTLPEIDLGWIIEPTRLQLKMVVGDHERELDFYTDPSEDVIVARIHRHMYTGDPPEPMSLLGISEALQVLTARDNLFILKCLGYGEKDLKHPKRFSKTIGNYIDARIFEYVEDLNEGGCKTSGSCQDLSSYSWTIEDSPQIAHYVSQGGPNECFIITVERESDLDWDCMLSVASKYQLALLKVGLLNPEPTEYAENQGMYVIFTYPQP